MGPHALTSFGPLTTVSSVSYLLMLAIRMLLFVGSCMKWVFRLLRWLISVTVWPAVALSLRPVPLSICGRS